MTDFFARLTKVKTFSGPAAGLSITASSVASSEAFGSAQLNLQVAPTGIASAEAFGTAQLNQQVEPVGVASAEAYGTAQLQFDQTVTASGIASAEAFGTTVVAGPLTVDTGIASAEAHGSPTVAGPIIATGIASEEVVAQNLGVGTHICVCVGIPSAEAFGAAQLDQQVVASGIASVEAFGTTELQHVIAPSSIASVEAFGTAEFKAQITPTAIASAEAFGTHSVSALVQPSAIASAEAFGTASVSYLVTATGIATAEAFGTAIVAGPIITSAITGAEAFGTAVLHQALRAEEIPSEEAFGIPALAPAIQPSSIASAEAFGTAQLDQEVIASAIASLEAFGADIVAGPVTIGAGIPTAEAFGAIVLTNDRIVPAAIASAETFGALSVDQEVIVATIASLEAFGTPALSDNVFLRPGGIVSEEAFGLDVVTGPITAVGIISRETFGVPRVGKFIDLDITPSTGIVGQQNEVALVGGALSMSACVPLLTLIDPGFWTDISSGGGAATSVSDGYLLDTTSVAGAVAGLRTNNTEENIDVIATFRLTDAVAVRGATVEVARLALTINDTPGNETDFSLVVERTNQGVRVFVRARVGGALTLDRPVSGGVSGDRAVLRLMKVGSRMIIFVGTRLALRADWTTGVASIDLTVANDPTRTSRAVATVTRYERRAIVLFGDKPLTETVARSAVQVIGTAPQIPTVGPVDVTVYGCNGIVDIVADAFTYALDPGSIRVVNAPETATMTAISDPVVRR